MADNGFKINKSANFNPQSGAPANPIDGDFYYDSTAQTFAYYHNGSWANFDSVGTVPTTLWLTGAQFTPAIVRNSVVKVTGGVSTAHLAGISASFSAKRITIYNAGSALIVVEPEDAMEPTANNRIQTPTGGSMNLIAGEVAVFTYDIVASRWLLVSISSQAGAQVIATTTNPGLVTLHQASLFPLDGVVLSDGDLNTANGVVGLDSNRAASIAAPIASANTLTLAQRSGNTALVVNGTTGSGSLMRLAVGGGTGSMLEWRDGSFSVVGDIDYLGNIRLESGIQFIQNNGGGTTDKFFIDNSDVQLAKRKLKFSNDDGFGNFYDNYMQYTYLGGLGTRGIKFVNQTNVGTGELWVQATGDGFGFARTDLILKASTGSDQYITNQQGSLYLNTFQSGNVNLGFASTGALNINSAFTGLWSIAGSGTSFPGAISAVGANRLIRNVQDPLLAQDAVTMQWAHDRFGARNLAINGNMRFWQRSSASLTFSNNSGPGYGASPYRYYRADRWFGFFRIDNTPTGIGSNDVTYQRVASGLTNTAYAARLTFASRVSGTKPLGFICLAQELDREFLKQALGKKLTLSFKWAKGSTMGNDGLIEFIIGTGSASANFIGYTGGSIISTEFVTNSSIPSSLGTVKTHVTSVTVPTNATGLAFYIGRATTTPSAPGVNNYLDITDVVLTIGDNAAQAPHYQYPWAGGDFIGEQALCQRYYEKNYNIDTDIGTNVGSSTYGTIVTLFTSGPYGDTPNVAYETEKWQIPHTIKYYSVGGTADVWNHSGGTSGIHPTLDKSGSTKYFWPTPTGSPNTTVAGSSWYGMWAADADI